MLGMLRVQQWETSLLLRLVGITPFKKVYLRRWEHLLQECGASCWSIISSCQLMVGARRLWAMTAPRIEVGGA